MSADNVVSQVKPGCTRSRGATSSGLTQTPPHYPLFAASPSSFDNPNANTRSHAHPPTPTAPHTPSWLPYTCRSLSWAIIPLCSLDRKLHSCGGGRGYKGVTAIDFCAWACRTGFRLIHVPLFLWKTSVRFEKQYSWTYIFFKSQ